MKSWLDKYSDDVSKAQNGIEGTMSGLTDEGFDYNGAWGGQFQMGGYVYPVNYVPKAQDGDIVPSDLPDPVNGIVYDPEGERTYYDDRLDRIVLTPSSNFAPRQSVINHEKFHKYQFDNLGSNYDIVHEGAVPLFRKPPMVSTDEEYYKFHNRKGREIQNDIDFVKSEHPQFKFLPDQLVYDKIVDKEQYENPFTLEGEAQEYENSLRKYQIGGSIPGSVGFTYTRTNSPAPSNGPYAKKTKASAQEGQTISVDEGDGKKRKILTDSKEYSDLFNEKRIGVKNDDGSISVNPLDEVVITPYDKQYPFYQELSDEEKKYFNSDSPIGRQIRSRAQDNVGFNADKAADFAYGWIRDLPLASLQAPQSALVETVEALRGNDFNMLNALEPDKQRIPSETWGVENPYAAFAVDALTDPETLTGMSLLKNPLQKGVKQLKKIPTSISPELRQGLRTNGISFKPKFNSEIDWGKWNKEIPDNTQLMNEYNAIEQQAKANGTWMKNPDGSSFQGTPEQFVQQNSSNFKKAFGNSKLVNPNGSYNILHHGSENPNLTEFKSPSQLDNFKKRTATTKNTEHIFTTNQKSWSENFAKKDGKIYDVYANVEKPYYAKDISEMVTPEIIPNYKNYDAITNLKLGEKDTRPFRELAVPNWNYLKSAIGNNGMFDMTNPNIYKSILPVTLGIGAASQLEEEPIPGMKQGGVIKDDLGQWAHPGEITEINSNDITMQGVPYPVLGISDTGDTKLMQPGKDYKFKGKKVTEYPLAKDGKELVKLNQLTNFTNYNTKQPGGWLDQY